MILLVDDDDALRRGFCRLLRAAGLEVEDASGSLAAVVALDAHAFEFVLTDFHMRDRDGLWLLEEVRTRQPCARRVLCTGDATDLSAYVTSGLVQRLLTKPCNARDLIAAMRP